MSGTARRCDVALVLVSHGDRGGGAGRERNAALMAHAEVVRGLAGVRAVTAGVLKGEPTFEAALMEASSSGARQGVVYPLLMADGYFASTVIPARIAAAGGAVAWRVARPLGVDPGIAALVLADGIAALPRAGIAAAAARLVIVGHGSKLGPASAEATRAAARRVADAGRFGSVATAFLEEPPFLADVLREGKRATVVSGFFLDEGLHAGEDVPAAIRAAGSRAVYAGAVGRSARVAGLVAAAVEEMVGAG